MSQRMTKAEYLKARGWICEEDHYHPLTGEGLMFSDLNAAVALQRARDAAEERTAWVAFAAAYPGHTIPPRILATFADAMLDEYRARFAI